MGKIKVFLKSLFEIESKAIFLENFKEKLEEYNDYAKKSNNYVAEKMPPFLPEVKTAPYSDRFYEETKYAEEPLPRHIYKISHYNNPKYGDLWACYVSIANSYMGTKRIHDCFIVSKIDDELKIIANFAQDIDQPKWKFYGGDEELKHYKLGKLIAVERLLAPEDDEWSMEEYNKDK